MREPRPRLTWLLPSGGAMPMSPSREMSEAQSASTLSASSRAATRRRRRRNQAATGSRSSDSATVRTTTIVSRWSPSHVSGPLEVLVASSTALESPSGRSLADGVGVAAVADDVGVAAGSVVVVVRL